MSNFFSQKNQNKQNSGDVSFMLNGNTVEVNLLKPFWPYGQVPKITQKSTRSCMQFVLPCKGRSNITQLRTIFILGFYSNFVITCPYVYLVCYKKSTSNVKRSHSVWQNSLNWVWDISLHALNFAVLFVFVQKSLPNTLHYIHTSGL